MGFASYSFATWSIIVIDPKTKEIGIAGASCTYNCYGIGGIVPGQGAIIVQAMSNKDARAKGMELIKAGSTPAQILEALRQPRYDPERQQYALVTAREMNSPATYTGATTHAYNGALTANGISVQGNTLATSDQIRIILAAALQAQKEGLTIDEVLMAALEAGSAAGGDKRCGDQRAMSAFITVAKPTDQPIRPFLNLNTFGQARGGQNAVDLLKIKHAKWKGKYKK